MRDDEGYSALLILTAARSLAEVEVGLHGESVAGFSGASNRTEIGSHPRRTRS